jgi:FMN hydrolase / 5-amino-6-(5-phospho-D-ribitylamino)uracil phosphatase
VLTFRRVIDWAPGEPAQLVYVGDHPEFDVYPAKAAGMRTAHIRRGPFGYLWADDPKLKAHADWRIEALTELPGLLAGPT